MKQLLKTAVFALLPTIFFSCYSNDEDEMMVFLEASDITKEEFDKYAERIDQAEQLINEHEAEVERYLMNPNNPDYYFKDFTPNSYVNTKSGWVGVVDLGLTHKWAAVNVGGVMEDATIFNVSDSFKDYLGIGKKLTKDDVLSEISVPYSEYKIGRFPDHPITKAIIENYIEGATRYAIDYKKYVGGYYKMAAGRYRFLSGQYDEYVVFGYPTMWEKGRTTTLTTSLKANDDAATVLWGDDWKTPSKSDLEELATRCTWEELYINNQLGAKVTGPSKKSIWLPLVGAKDTKGAVQNAEYGYYMSDTKDIQNTLLNVYTLCCTTHNASVRLQPGEFGYCLRPVMK